jgi:hypothetical protein
MSVRNKIRDFVKLTLVMIFLCCGLTVFSQDLSLTVISNPEGAPSSLTFSELRSIFMSEKQRWRNGIKISLALLKTNTPGGKNTALKVYGMNANELNKFWLALVFQGKAGSPNFFNSASELEAFVAQNPGAIGILDEVAANNEIKTISIEGKKIL